MEAPFRFAITGFADVERLLDVLAASPELVPGSLYLAEGQELLEEQLACEGRLGYLKPALSRGDFRRLLRALWQRPLEAQRPRFLRFYAKLANAKLSAGNDAVGSSAFSMRINVPTTGALPRWIDLEGSRDPAVLAHLRATYASIGREAKLTLLEV